MKESKKNGISEVFAKQNNDLLASQERYEKLTKNLSNVKWVLDLETMKFVYVNHSAEMLRGFSPDEVLKQDAKDSFKSASNEFLKRILPERLATFIETNELVHYTDEFEQPCKNGATICVEITSFFSTNPFTNKVELIGASRNINLRKIAEKKAYQEQQHKELFISNAPFAIIEWDKEQNILAWNPMANHIFGYNESEAIGENFFTLLIPESENIDIKQVVEELLSKSKIKKHINYNLTKSGKIILCEWYNTPLFNAARELIGITSMAKDITEFENAQKEKEKANIKHQQLITELHEGVGIVDLNEDFIFVNPAFEKMIGYKSAQLIGQNLKNYIPESIFSNIVNETKKRKQGKTSNYSTKLISKNGEIKAVNISASPWQNEVGEIVGTMALIIDVTDQIKANEELNRRYNFEKRIFNISSRFIDNDNFSEKVRDSLNDIGLLSNAESVIVVKFDYRNKLCQFEFTWHKSNSVNRQNFEPCSLSIFASAIVQLNSNEQFYIKSINELKDELEPLKTYFIKNAIDSLMGFPIFVGAKLYGFLGVLNILKDNTWSKNEFILLRSAGEILCNAIQRKINEDQILALNTQLSEKNNEIEQVLYVTSHDIRSPLVNIIGFTKELNKSIDELKEYLSHKTISSEDRENINFLIIEDIPEVLNFINAGGIKIDKLLNSLLRLSRLGRTPLELSNVNTSTIVHEIIESMEYQIQTFKIDVKSSDLPEIVTDRNLFTQIMTNLIDNAVKYHDENKQSIIYIESTAINSEVIFTITDNGVGIPDDKKDRVFEVFNRLNPQKTEGEGIGLAIIKKAVERLNGKINLESTFGEGCKFTLIFNKN
ncbi:MAG: PAS domain S-box protein [Salinivirgaceae bacterium]|jgi:PAS domain S-box-containing protein|nr:PAS domain S-box protein [Salinivirgaceae bacterium]